MAPPASGTGLFDPNTNEILRSMVPNQLLPLFEFITLHGDPAFLLLVVAVYYWTVDQDSQRTATIVFGICLVGFAVTNVLKGLVGFERPVEHLVFVTDAYGGFGFPSGHTVGATVVYVTIAAVSSNEASRRRFVVAGVLITLVGFSRVVIGVHYLGDVIGGIFIGLVVVWGSLRGVERLDIGPLELISVAIILSLVSYAGPSRAFMPETIGAGFGAMAAILTISDSDLNIHRQPTRQSISVHQSQWTFVGLCTVVLVLIVGLRVASTGIYPGSNGFIGWPTEFVGYAVATAGIVLVPYVAGLFDEERPRKPLERQH